MQSKWGLTYEEPDLQTAPTYLEARLRLFGRAIYDHRLSILLVIIVVFLGWIWLTRH